MQRYTFIILIHSTEIAKILVHDQVAFIMNGVFLLEITIKAKKKLEIYIFRNQKKESTQKKVLVIIFTKILLKGKDYLQLEEIFTKKL